MPKWLFPTLMILTGMTIVIFNDLFGDSEVFGSFAMLYFLLLFYLLIRWFFRHIKLIITLKNEKAKTELLHLKNQVNPHFFFNTLNNLYGLVGTDTAKAKALILKLSDMMRYSIYECDKDFVQLEQEVEYLQQYIELHRMRYRKIIDIQFKVEISEGYLVMPLLFLILLENAFKHGVENLRMNAYVHTRLWTDNETIHFEVENNFDPEANEKPGIGLKNLIRRLELGYPKAHHLRLSKKEDRYNAHLTLIQK